VFPICVPLFKIIRRSSTVVIAVVVGCTLSTPTPVSDPTSVPIDSSRSTATEAQSDFLITNPQTELTFTIDDFPLGWQMESQGEADGGYQVRAIKLGTIITLPEDVVASWVKVFPSRGAASASYIEQRQQKAQRFRLDDPNIADESFIYEGNATDEVYFRTRNVLARVTMFTQYGGSLSEVTQWAQNLEAKIDEVKRLGDSRPSALPTLSPTEFVPTSTMPPPATSARPRATPTLPQAATGDVARIAFTTDRDGNLEIYVMNADGSGQTNLTNSPKNADLHPTWSPLGNQVAYTCRLGGNVGRLAEICVMNADGNNQVQLTANTAEESYPAWSPAGNKIAFVSSRDGNNEIYVMGVDGSNQTPLTHNDAHDEMPAWSPDGKKIAFISNRNDTWQIFVMDSNGSNQRPLTDPSFRSLEPAWSHDGKYITYSSDRSGSNDIWVMQADGSNHTNITNDPSLDDRPSWSPDDTKITFRRGKEIYRMNADGSEPTNLTNSASFDFYPTWEP